MPRNSQSTETGMVWQGIEQYIRRRTVRIVDTKDDSGGGSGVTIQFKGRHFVATAAHVLRDDHEYGILVRDEIPRLIQDFKKIYKSESEDVALIELGNCIEALTTDHDFLLEEEIYLGRYPSNQVSLQLVGYPGFAVQKSAPVAINSSNSISVISFETLSYDTNALSRSSWPTGAVFPRRHARCNDIFCEYRPGQQEASRRDMRGLDRPDVNRVLSQVPLNGMSGCGIWMPHNYIKPSEITYLGAKLVGIQVSYPTNGKGKWLRGVRSRVIVDLLNVV